MSNTQPGICTPGTFLFGDCLSAFCPRVRSWLTKVFSLACNSALFANCVRSRESYNKNIIFNKYTNVAWAENKTLRKNVKFKLRIFLHYWRSKLSLMMIERRAGERTEGHAAIMIESRPLFLIKNKGFISPLLQKWQRGALVLSLTGPGLPTHPRLLSAPRVRQWMSVIERCHFVAYSFVFPVLSSLSAMRCIVAARRPHSSTPTLQNTNNQEDSSIPPRLCLVNSHTPTFSF